MPAKKTPVKTPIKKTPVKNVEKKNDDKKNDDKKNETENVVIKKTEAVIKSEEAAEKLLEEQIEEPEEIPEEIELEEEDEDDNFGDDNAEIEDEDKKMDAEVNEEVDLNDDEDAPEKDNCIYNAENAEDASDNEEEIAFDDDDTTEIKIIVDKSERITKPILFHYERVRLIGDRTQQLTLGAKPLVKNIEKLSSKEIALLELEHNMIPLIIERPLPNGRKERWHLSELKH